jgi:hypothetical protein
MSLVVNRSTGGIIPFANTPDYPPEQWLINPVLPDGVPWKYLKVSGDFVVEMTQDEKNTVDNPPLTTAERHLQEQETGVTLDNGWVMRWTEKDQTRMGTAKDIADLLALANDNSPLVPFYEADGTKHSVTYSTAYQVLADYMAKVMVEQNRQEAENG